MTKGRYVTKHTQRECEHIAKLRRQKLTWTVIAQRMGLSVEQCRLLAGRARDEAVVVRT